MARQIDKKWIADGAIDGSKIQLLEGQSIIIQVDGEAVELLKLNENGNASLPQGEVPNIDYVDTAITDLQELLEQDIANRISTVEDSIAQEILDRQTGDENTLVAANEYTDQKVADLVASAPEVLDTLKELADALGGDANFATTVAGQIGAIDDKVDQEIEDRQAADQTLQGNIDDLEERVEFLEGDKEVIQVESLGDAPAIGLEGKLYLTQDDNKLYRWALVGGGSLTFDKVVGAGEEYATLQDALAAAVDGENILVKAGTYSVTSAINVTKQVKIVGEDRATVIFETAGASSDPTSVFNVSVDNVALAKMTIKHKKSSNTSIETAVIASGGGFPQTRIANFIMEECTVEFLEFGLVVRAESWTVRDTTFTYATGTVSNSCRAIGIYGNKGNSFIKDVFLKNDVINGTAFRPFYLTSTTGNNPNETTEGKLVVEGVTHSGQLAQFFNQDNQQSAGPGTFELQIKNNVTNESNLFAGFAAGLANSGDMFSSITLSGNTISNLHAVDGGKGLFGVYGAASFRTTDLIVHASNNTLGQEVYRTGWVAVDGSLIGKENATPAFTVAKDSIIPATGEIPTALSNGGTTGAYLEVSPEPDLSGIESDIADLQNQVASLGDTFATDQELADAVSALENSISAEQEARELADTGLQEQIDDLEEAVDGLDTRVTALETFNYDQVLYVSKNGLDTNSGKQHSPFLTITAAQNAITDASPSKRYAIKVMPGNYTEASLALKANVFIVGEGNKEAVRITGAVSLASDFTGSGDHRSGFHRVTLLSAADFNWQTVTSAAGKLYMSEVVFGSTLNMYGHNNAIAQAQFNSCVIFGAVTISGINVGVFTDNICYNNITLNQHPNGGMVTTISATGGYCGGTFRLNSTANDFNRRSSAFLRDFWSENLISDGPVSYADVDLTSGSKQGAQRLNGGQVIALTPKVSHDLETQMIKPLNTNAHNMGDWGKQWFWNFGYVHASTGTDLFLISYPSSYAPDSSGKSIGIYTDGAGLQDNVDGGEIVLQTAATTGTGVRGKVILDGREIDVTSKKVTNLAAGEANTDAVNKGQLDSAISAIPVIIFEKENKTVDATIISDTYWDLAFEAKPNSVHLFAERIPLIEDYDYSVSVVDGKTRITFLAPMLVPSEEALEVGDELHVKYSR
jgi:gas vesicle protein/TolA-binding protein